MRSAGWFIAQLSHQGNSFTPLPMNSVFCAIISVSTSCITLSFVDLVFYRLVSFILRDGYNFRTQVLICGRWFTPSMFDE